MTARVGIELSPSACRIVEIDGQHAWARRPSDTRVRSFAVLPPSGPDTRAKLESLRRATAAVVVWSATSEHRQVVVTGGSYESMRAEALAALAAAGLQTRGVAADVAPVVGPPRKGVRQPVLVALAAAPDLSSALQPLRAAGIRLRTVTTPAVALGSLARLRRAFSVPGAIEAYVALEQTATCIALVRDNVLVAARQLAWGYAEDASGIARPREEIASRLADGVSEFVAAIGGGARDIGQVCVCGGLPELRSMTAPLMERLDVEVEPLDSMFGIDAANVPEPADEFRERGAELRLAWAVAADWPSPINLLRAQRRRASKTMLSRAAVAAGVAAGLAVGWRVQQSQWWQSTAPTPRARTTQNAAARGRPATPAPRVMPPPAVAQGQPAFVPPPDVGPKLPPVVTPPPAVAQSQPAFVPPPDVGPKLPPVMTPQAAVAQNRPPAAVAQSQPAFVPPPDVGPKLPPVVMPPPAVAQNKPPAVTPPRQEPARSALPPPRVTSVEPPTTKAPAVASAPRQTPPVVRADTPPARSVPAAPVRTEPGPRIERAPARIEPPPTRVEPAAPKTEPPPRIEAAPARTEPTPTEPARTARARTESARTGPARTESTRTEPAGGRSSPSAARGKPAPNEVALPFDAALGTILYSPDRKLAIIDGRIVGLGDEVRGARVLDITPNAVTLRDAQGRLRRLTLGAGR